MRVIGYALEELSRIVIDDPTRMERSVREAELLTQTFEAPLGVVTAQTRDIGPQQPMWQRLKDREQVLA